MRSKEQHKERLHVVLDGLSLMPRDITEHLDGHEFPGALLIPLSVMHSTDDCTRTARPGLTATPASSTCEDDSQSVRYPFLRDFSSEP